jgi:DNA-binding NarL/FixJ family response regulator
VILADTYVVVRIGIRCILNQTRDTRVVGETADLVEMIELVEKTNPHVLVVGLAMAGMGWIEVFRTLEQYFSLIRVLVLIPDAQKDMTQQVLNMGIGGCIRNPEIPERIVNMVRQLARRSSENW